MAIKLAPEIVAMSPLDPNSDLAPEPNAAFNLLRPGNPFPLIYQIIFIKFMHLYVFIEAVESIFVLYRVTGEEKYREWAWNIFQAFKEYSMTDAGFSSHDNVNSLQGKNGDKMETFFMAETMKYLYLTFCDPSVMPLDEFVLNTEAHPLRIWKS